MKRSSYFLIFIAGMVLTLGSHILADTVAHTFFTHRSQGINLETWWLSGQALHTHLCNTDCINGSLAITPYYSQTFNSKQLGNFFFGLNDDDVNGNIINFGPADSTGVKVFSRNLFLNDTFRSTVKAEPQASNFVLDLNLYLGLDEWVPGLYFRVDVPINWTSWSMRLTEELIDPGTEIEINRLGNDAARQSPRSSALEGFAGEILQTNNFPDLKQPMNYARIAGKKEATHVADVRFALGYDFVCNECGHFGINFQVVAPTGNAPEARFVFEPIVGNGHHVEVGGGISGRWELWSNGCDQSFSALLEGVVTHLFSSKQRRTFDLKNNGPLSRYLLIKKFANGTYDNEILFGPNVLTRQIKVQNDAQGEGILMFDYQNCGFTFDVGYALWGRTKDKITIVDPIIGNTYGIQGNTSTDSGDASVNTTQSLSTIFGLFAPGDQAGNAGDLIFITTDDLDIASAEHPGAVSHKLFTHFAYTWEYCDYLPFLGAGGSVEFSGRGNRAFDQWAVWIKGGFTFA